MRFILLLLTAFAMDLPIPTPRVGQEIQPMQGMRVWRNPDNEFVVARVHYEADPARRGDWKYRASPKYGGLKSWRWRKEQEIDWHAQSGALVFELWNPDTHILARPFEIPEHWPRWALIDPGWRNPTSIDWVAIDIDAEPNLFGYLPIHVYREFYRSRHSTQAFTAIMSEWSKTRLDPDDEDDLLTWEWIEEVIIDPMAKQEHQAAAKPANVTEPAETVYQQVVDALESYGWDVPIDTGNNEKPQATEELIARIGRFWVGPNDVPLYDEDDRFREPTEQEKEDGAALITPTLFFHPTCVEGPREMSKYRFRDWASNEVADRHNLKEQPIDKDDHAITNLIRLVNRLRDFRDVDGVDLGEFTPRRRPARWKPVDEVLAERHRTLAGRYRKRIARARKEAGL